MVLVGRYKLVDGSFIAQNPKPSSIPTEKLISLLQRISRFDILWVLRFRFGFCESCSGVVSSRET